MCLSFALVCHDEWEWDFVADSSQGFDHTRAQIRDILRGPLYIAPPADSPAAKLAAKRRAQKTNNKSASCGEIKSPAVVTQSLALAREHHYPTFYVWRALRRRCGGKSALDAQKEL
jgi:hypothetical protein